MTKFDETAVGLADNRAIAMVAALTRRIAAHCDRSRPAANGRERPPGRVGLQKGEPMLDYGTLPPEINSTRMYSGAGAESMMAAAAAWDVLANALESVSRVYSSTISRLRGEGWSGSASEAMAGAAARFVAWVSTAGVQAAAAASQARAAAAAYEMAFAATVPPTLVAANRIQLATLIATNVLGHNSAGIAALDAQYEQMWARDAAAMYNYAASSSAATTLGQFTRPTQTTNAAARAATVAQATGSSSAGNAQTALSQLMSRVPRELQALATGSFNPAQTTGTTPMLDAFSAFNTLTGPASLGSNFSRTTTSALSGYSGISRTAIQSGNEAAKAASGAAKAATAGADSLGSAVVRGPVLASVGNAPTLGKTTPGKLSVPQSWATTDPAVTPVAEPHWLSDADIGGEPGWQEVPATNVWGGVPAAGAGIKSGLLSSSSVNNVLRVGPRKFTMPRPSLGG